MNQNDRQDLIDAAFIKEQEEDVTKIWWMAFYDKKQARGSIFIKCIGYWHAMIRIRELDINPGGLVQGFFVLPQYENRFTENHFNRLWTQDEVEAMGLTDGWK